jgi:hypothetical protein
MKTKSEQAASSEQKNENESKTAHKLNNSKIRRWLHPLIAHQKSTKWKVRSAQLLDGSERRKNI